MVRVAIALVLLTGFVALFFIEIPKLLWLPVMLILGATIGVVMGVEYPFGLEFKLAYVGGLAVAAALALWGFRTPRKMPGLIAIVAGASLWIMLGLLGLGTGT